MTLANYVMLICGTVLFVLAVGLIIFLHRKNKTFHSAIALLLLSVAMIGFNSIKVLDFLGFHLKAQQSITDFNKNPGDPTAAANLSSLVEDYSQQARKGIAIPPQIQDKLQATVTAFKGRTDLPPASLEALKRTRALLKNDGRCWAANQSGREQSALGAEDKRRPATAFHG